MSIAKRSNFKILYEFLLLRGVLNGKNLSLKTLQVLSLFSLCSKTICRLIPALNGD